MSNPTRLAVEAAISRVLSQSGRTVPTFSDEQILSGDLKLDSLDLAQVVVQLETDLGVDPFRSGNHSVNTLGDLVGLYTERTGD